MEHKVRASSCTNATDICALTWLIPTAPKWADPVHPTQEEKLAAADVTFAYCGRYEIDVKQKQIVHMPEVATKPGYVGSRQIRPHTFENGRLVLSDIEKNDPTVARWKIVWEKSQ